MLELNSLVIASFPAGMRIKVRVCDGKIMESLEDDYLHSFYLNKKFKFFTKIKSKFLKVKKP